MNENIEKCNSNKTKINFLPEKENEINEFLEKIKIFGKLEVIKDNDRKLEAINEEEVKLIFKFKEGKNYTLSNNCLIATKTEGGDNWNCTIVGNKEIPKNKISKWKIKINNFQIDYFFGNSWNILIGIGPDNPNNEENFYMKSWTFICGESKISIKSGKGTRYNNKKQKTLKKGDIIEVIVDRKLGNLSFAINGENYGIACSEIPKEDTLYPIVMINDENQIVEIV